MVLYGTINVYGLGYGSQDTMNFNFFKCLEEFSSTQSVMYGCFKSFLSNVDIFVWSAIWLPSYHTWQLTWHHKCVWSWIWFPRHHELEFFSSVLKSFFPLRKQCMGVLRAFQAMLVFLNGQLYGCQVTMNSIYGLDMVAKKGLWWSTRVL